MPTNISNITQSQEDPNKREGLPQTEPVEKQPAEIEVEPKIEKETQPDLSQVREGLATRERQEPVSTAPTTAVQPGTKSQTLEKIEDILQEDLEDIYFQMSPEKQAEFRRVGEETASNIEGLLKEVKVKVKKVLELITKWLKIVPGINQYFLRQEAKIKADKILELKEQENISVQQDKNKI